MEGAQIVADILSRSGLSKTELCRRAEMGRAQLDRYLHGKASPNVAQVARLLEAAHLTARVELTPAARPMNPRLIGVLGMGSILPRRGTREELVDTRDIWNGSRKAENGTEQRER